MASEGYPYIIKGSTLLKRLTEALFNLTNVALLIWRKRKSLKILITLGECLLMPLIRMTKATFFYAGI